MPLRQAMDTEQLIQAVQKMSNRIDEMTETRHKGNEALNSIILKFTEQTERHESRIQLVEATVSKMIGNLSNDLRDIKTRLIGDEALKSDGLIQQHNGVTMRLDRVEQTAKDNKNEIASLKRERIVAVSVLAAGGATLAWIKGWFHGN